MRIIAVDDRKIALENLLTAIKEAEPDSVVKGFRSSAEAYDFALENPCEIAFLDIQMHGFSGIELAKRLKINNPKINIIFTTGYSEYAGEAFKLHASGYIMKPVTTEKIRKELDNLRFPLAAVDSKRVRIHAFGNFEVTLDGIPVEFQYQKTKELLAYLVDRCGALCTNREIMAVLWENEIKESYFKNIRVDLLKCLPKEIFVKQRGRLGVIPDMVSCDYYEWIDGKPLAINAYTGEYMTQYSWAETTLGDLKRNL